MAAYISALLSQSKVPLVFGSALSTASAAIRRFDVGVGRREAVSSGTVCLSGMDSSCAGCSSMGLVVLLAREKNQVCWSDTEGLHTSVMESMAVDSSGSRLGASPLLPRPGICGAGLSFPLKDGPPCFGASSGPDPARRLIASVRHNEFVKKALRPRDFAHGGSW